MPRQHLPGMGENMRSLTITITDDSLDLYDGMTVDLKVQTGDGSPTTVWRDRLSSLECDYLDTLVQRATHGFAYGGDWRDVARAAVVTKREARRHAQRVPVHP